MKADSEPVMAKSQGRPALSVVIPTFGRSEVLEQNLLTIRQALLASPVSEFEIIVVDDASPDDTAQVIRRLCNQWPELKGLVLAQNCGQQCATLAGLRRAAGDRVVTMDDDLKDRPEDIQRLLDCLDSGYDVVYGIPDRQIAVPWLRRIGTAGKEWLIGIICHKPKKIRLTGFRVLNRATADRVCLESRRHPYLSATILQQPVRIGQVTVQTGRQTHRSGYSPGKLAGVLFWLVISYANIPLLKSIEQYGNPHPIREELP